MTNVRRTLFAAACSVAIGSAVTAFAAGMYSNFPVVGSAAYCAAINASGPGVGGTTGQTGTNTICAQTVPAGPPDLTGAEVVNADTGVATPATANVPVPSLASGVFNYVGSAALQPANLAATGTFTIPNLVNTVILDPTGTLSSATITLPSAPLDGQILRIVSSQAVTPTLVVTASSAQASTLKIKNAPTALGTTTATGPWSASFIYNLGQNTWFRL